MLQSRLFREDKHLQATLIDDRAHVTPGSRGAHVQRIQRALIYLGERSISGIEYTQATYGTSTAAAVLRYKTARRIINRAYQTQPDNIVGKMTIGQLDGEMLRFEAMPTRALPGGGLA